MQHDPEKAKIHTAEAQALRDDPAFQRAVLAARQQLLEQLATVDPRDPEAIRRIQSDIRAIDLLAEMLANEIIRGLTPRPVAVA